MSLMPRKNYKKSKTGGRRRRATYRPRKSKGYAYHAPKKFESEFKILDVNAEPFGSHADGYSRNKLSVSLAKIPIFTNLRTLYRQFAITSVKLMYRPKVNMSDGGISLAQLLFVEDKDSDIAISPLQARSEDNCRVLTCNRPWKHFIKMPRPLLYQQSADGNPVKVIQRAKELHWLSPESEGDVPSNLEHLFGQLCVSDVTGATDDVGVGELWCKVYFSCKEQRKANAI